MSAESVLAAQPQIGAMRAAFTGACRTMTATVNTQGTDVRTRIVRTVLDAPKGWANDLLVVEEQSSSSVSGRTFTQKSYQAYAKVGAYAVTVSAQAMTDEPDRSAFDALLAKAIDKAASA